MINNLKDVCKFANELADTARQNTLKYFKQALVVENKQDLSPVTVADRETEFILREMISKNFPDHGIVGEELGVENVDAEFVWIIDPIDGTGSFITGLPLYGTLLSLLKNQNPVLGLIDMPVLKERWFATSNAITRYNNSPCRSSDCSDLSSAKLISTTIDMFSDTQLQLFNKLSSKVALRRFGGDCYCYGLLASGHVDLVVESDLKPYDYMAHVPIIEGSGGVISDWQGHPLRLDSGPQVVAAATPTLHQRALEYLR